MPNDTIDRAIKRGTGELEGVNYDEITYEGYGIGGVAVLIETMTDNRNRTVAELRHLFSKNGGNLGEAGSVAWMFDKKGYIVVDKEAKSEDELFEIAIEAGAEDMQDEGDVFEIYTSPENYDAVDEAIKNRRNRTASVRNFDDSAKLHQTRRRRCQKNAQTLRSD